ncbi:MAG: RT0821/Lpp0805 family surface protein [Pseudomonadota bacterium]|nr:RT0821/Lpp0805 family surface protein [Pseudomonadota bacterium]
MKRHTAIIVLIVGALSLSACSTATKEEIGTATGAILGGALGYGLGKGHKDKGMAIAVGTLFGAIAGNQIGKQLDQADRAMAGQSLQQSLENNPVGTATGWQNPDSGHSGHSVPTRTFATAGGTPCREFTTTVNVGGQSQEAYGTACRQADGSWKITN